MFGIRLHVLSFLVHNMYKNPVLNHKSRVIIDNRVLYTFRNKNNKRIIKTKMRS